MPYSSVADLPESIRNALPADAQRRFMVVANAYLRRGKPDSRAMAAAWKVVANGWEKGEDGKWKRRASLAKQVLRKRIHQLLEGVNKEAKRRPAVSSKSGIPGDRDGDGIPYEQRLSEMRQRGKRLSQPELQSASRAAAMLASQGRSAEREMRETSDPAALFQARQKNWRRSIESAIWSLDNYAKDGDWEAVASFPLPSKGSPTYEIFASRKRELLAARPRELPPKPSYEGYADNRVNRPIRAALRTLSEAALRGDINTIIGTSTAGSHTNYRRLNEYRTALIQHFSPAARAAAVRREGTIPPVPTDNQIVEALRPAETARRESGKPSSAANGELYFAQFHLANLRRIAETHPNPLRALGNYNAIGGGGTPSPARRLAVEYQAALIAHFSKPGLQGASPGADTPTGQTNAGQEARTARRRLRSAAARESEEQAAQLNWKPLSPIGGNVTRADIRWSANDFNDPRTESQESLKRFASTLIADYGGRTRFNVSASVMGRSMGISFTGDDGTQISRTFTKEADGLHVKHGFFRAGVQGEGSGKRFQRVAMGEYIKMGVKKITLNANLDVGGYAWARYGYLPQADEWRRLRQNLAWRVDRYLRDGSYTREEHAAVKKILNNPRGKAIWELADIQVNGKKLGKDLLLGQSWDAYLDLNNEAQMTRFTRYVSQSGARAAQPAAQSAAAAAAAAAVSTPKPRPAATPKAPVPTKSSKVRMSVREYLNELGDSTPQYANQQYILAEREGKSFRAGQWREIRDESQKLLNNRAASLQARREREASAPPKPPAAAAPKPPAAARAVDDDLGVGNIAASYVSTFGRNAVARARSTLEPRMRANPSSDQARFARAVLDRVLAIQSKKFPAAAAPNPPAAATPKAPAATPKAPAAPPKSALQRSYAEVMRNSRLLTQAARREMSVGGPSVVENLKNRLRAWGSSDSIEARYTRAVIERVQEIQRSEPQAPPTPKPPVAAKPQKSEQERRSALAERLLERKRRSARAGSTDISALNARAKRLLADLA